MIDPDQIPDEVVESAAKVIATVNEPIDKWLYHLPEARAAIAAALNSWPALEVCYFLPQGRTITLPFPNVSKIPAQGR